MFIVVIKRTVSLKTWILHEMTRLTGPKLIFHIYLNNPQMKKQEYDFTVDISKFSTITLIFLIFGMFRFRFRSERYETKNK